MSAEEEERICKVYIAIFSKAPNNDMPLYKHWALAVIDTWRDEKGEEYDESFKIQAMGFSGHYRLDMQLSNAKEDESMIKMVPICRIYESMRVSLMAAAEQVAIRDYDLTWNCQNFVLDLLEHSRNEGLLTFSDAKMDEFRAMEEGFVAKE
ncbi:uncharacterized protein LTHEOB_2876 [Lasiodiplodia theobromae]|uniref:uncharacterized protein n=1 Tax=Lasiodiplodia theobromae TaxID=45133 RepID=UPI0015C40A42|nr:uncharacterized protein LTHEOB_2876 [Lasiodiplodia theobromae]KAF4534901.1 hypothetical protein LTHEOB_2876 [Lasiodiplodia theobromae]